MAHYLREVKEVAVDSITLCTVVCKLCTVVLFVLNRKKSAFKKAMVGARLGVISHNEICKTWPNTLTENFY